MRDSLPAAAPRSTVSDDSSRRRGKVYAASHTQDRILPISRTTVAITVWTVLFCLFLLPIEIDSISVNYSFLLLPLACLLFTGKVTIPPRRVFPVMVLYILIFIIASAYQYQYLDEGLRRIASFVLFMGMFSYMLVSIDAEMIASFKASLVIISALLSTYAVYVFLVSGGSALGFEAKTIVGNQRVGFLYLLAFWVVYLHRGSSRIFVPVKYSILVVLLSGLLLTFSRSSIIGLLMSLGLYALVNGMGWFTRPSFKGIWRAIAAVAVVSSLFGLLYTFVPLAFTFFDERLFSLLSDPDGVSEDIGNVQSTGGTRVFLLRTILDFTLTNPLTGAGYLGVWILPVLANISGSAHSQYMDVLFRTGFIGFVAYVYLLLLLAKQLYKNERSLFWGLVAILAYGLFHETFKESQGGFVLAFLLGMMSKWLRKQSTSA